MKVKRAKIVATLEINLDPVPGFGHRSSDWAWMVQMALQTVMKAQHYHPTLVIEDKTPKQEGGS